MVIDVADITLGQWLQQVRGNRKAIALAEEAGMTPQQWSDLETDRSRRKDGSPARPTVETCMKLARVLGQPLETVLFYAGYPTGESLLRSDALIAETFDVPSPIQNDPNSPARWETREIAEDLLDEFDRQYARFEADSWFQKLTPSERIAAVNRIIQEIRQRERG
jgi:transcriptional regulator with XRE-family HTH domain